MAKITVAGAAVVVTSSLKLEDIQTVKKYRPEALTLKGGEDGKEPIFKLGIVSGGNGSINKYGAEFPSHTNNAEGKATMTLVMAETDKDVKEVVADSIGAYVMTLGKLEELLPAVLEEIAVEKAAILENITITA